MKLILQNEADQWSQNQINFFNQQTEKHIQISQKMLQQQALFVFTTIMNNNELTKALFSISTNDSITSKSILHHFQKNTRHYLENKQYGIVALRFITIKNNIYTSETTNNHNIISIKQTQFKIDSPKTDTLQGINIINNTIIYSFLFPVVSEDTFYGYIEIGFDAIKTTKSNLPNLFFETLIVAFECQNSEHFDMLIDKITISKYENYCLLHNFDITLSINNKLNTFINKQLKNTEIKTASWHVGYNKTDSIFTLSKIPILLQNTLAFSVNWNCDTMLKKAKELNNAVLIINIFVIFSIMMGFTLTVLNRLKIANEKKEIQQSENKLKEINQSKDRFFSIVAHDLKNPFNGIMGLSGYLMHDYDMVDDNERKEIINDINIASKNAFNLLQNLLEWTRAQSGTINNNPVIIVPKQTVSLSLETVSNLAKNKEIEIIEKYLTEEKGYADENMITTVIRNLTTNAIKFTPRGRKIEIISSTYKNELYFQVKDYGIGIDHHEIDQLFRIDVNFHKRGTEKETGTGLGLKLCKEFVENCGGRIWCISELGKGSSFYFTIPKYNELNHQIK